MRRTAVVTLATVAVGALTTGAMAAPAKAVPLAAKITGPSSTQVGKSVSFSLAKTTVPKGDKVKSFTLTYSDGSKKVSGKGSEPRTESHKFTRVGTFTVKLSITDIKNKTSSASAKITVKAPAPVASGVAITSILSPVSPGSTEQATGTSKPGDSCDFEVTLPSGRQSTEPGLGTKTVGTDGTASWTWTITRNTNPGTATATLACGAGKTTRTFTIG